MKKEKIQFPLSRKIALMATAMALLVSLIVIVFNYQYYKTEMFEHYEQDARNVCVSAAGRIDPDRVAEYLAAGEKDEAY
jgi:hypothetical protein